jgi:hypothetical protein
MLDATKDAKYRFSCFADAPQSRSQAWSGAARFLGFETAVNLPEAFFGRHLADRRLRVLNMGSEVAERKRFATRSLAAPDFDSYLTVLFL